MKKNNFIKMLSIFMVGISSIALTVPFVTSCSSNEKKQDQHIQVDNNYPWWPSDVHLISKLFNSSLLPIIVKKFKESLPSGQITLKTYFGYDISYKTIDDEIRNKVDKLTFSNINDLFFYDKHSPNVDHDMYKNILEENTNKLSFCSIYDFDRDVQYSRNAYVCKDLYTTNTFIIKKTDEIVYDNQFDYENKRMPIPVYELSAGSGTIVIDRFNFYLYIEELQNIAPIIYPSNTIQAFSGNIEIPVKELFPNTIKFAYSDTSSSSHDPIGLFGSIIEYYNKGWFRG